MEYYDYTAKGYDELHKEEQLAKLTIIDTLIQVKGKLLDVGCGTGISTLYFKDKAACTGLDPSKEMLKQFLGTKVLGQAEHLPFEDKTFDVVISVTALHLSDMNKSIPELERVCKGVVAISLLKKSKSITHLLLKEYIRYDCDRDYLFVKYM